MGAVQCARRWKRMNSTNCWAANRCAVVVSSHRDPLIPQPCEGIGVFNNSAIVQLFKALNDQASQKHSDIEKLLDEQGYESWVLLEAQENVSALSNDYVEVSKTPEDND